MDRASAVGGWMYILLYTFDLCAKSNETSVFHMGVMVFVGSISRCLDVKGYRLGYIRAWGTGNNCLSSLHAADLHNDRDSTNIVSWVAQRSRHRFTIIRDRSHRLLSSLAQALKSAQSLSYKSFLSASHPITTAGSTDTPALHCSPASSPHYFPRPRSSPAYPRAPPNTSPPQAPQCTPSPHS